MRVGMIPGPRHAPRQPLDEVTGRQLSLVSSEITSRTRLDSTGRRGGMVSRGGADRDCQATGRSPKKAAPGTSYRVS
jgi:hypothetical protein